MKIKMLSTLAGPNVSASVGQKVDLEETFALELIEKGYAIAIETNEKAEAARAKALAADEARVKVLEDRAKQEEKEKEAEAQEKALAEQEAAEAAKKAEAQEKAETDVKKAAAKKAEKK